MTIEACGRRAAPRLDHRFVLCVRAPKRTIAALK